MEYGGFGDRRGTGVIALGDLVRGFLLRSNASHQSTQTTTTTTTTTATTTPTENQSSAPVPVAYMSQHALFHQVPSLQTKFAVPPYTMGRLRADTGAVNAWIGTKDTTTVGGCPR